MLSLHQITKSYDLNKILFEITFNVNPGERVGLIGPNGCGKTTLFRIITGEETPDSGHVSFAPSNLRVGYLTQGFEPTPGISVKALIQEASKNPEILEAELVRISTELASNPNDPELQRDYDIIIEELQAPSDIGRLKSILAALGLDELPDEQIASTLSGGQKTRLALALVLLSDPQLLLLDEPTNHLDIEMLEWLEDWLSGFRGAALIVSHDRAFLESTVTRILDLNPATQTVQSYEGSYTDYLEQVTSERDKQWNAYRDQVTEIRRIRQDIAAQKSKLETLKLPPHHASQACAAMPKKSP